MMDYIVREEVLSDKRSTWNNIKYKQGNYEALKAYFMEKLLDVESHNQGIEQSYNRSF